MHREAYRIYVERTEVKKPLGRPKHRWVDINKTDVIE
jgi:hypothetical protein